MFTRGVLFMAVSMLLAFSLTSCGDSKAAPAKPSDVAASKAPEAPSNDALMKYFEAVWSSDIEEVKTATEMAAPGSHAEAYATYLTASIQASLDAGQPYTDDAPVEGTETGFQQCLTAEDGTKDCTEATGIKHVDGKVADFSTDGKPIGNRIVLGNGHSQRLGDLGEATLIAVYRTAEGNLFAVLEIKSNVDALTLNWQTNYVAPSGRQTQTDSMSVPTELSKGALANALIRFQGAQFGGKLRLKVFTNSNETFREASTEFKVR